MSYAFGMFFKQVNNKEDAFEIALKFCKECYKEASEVLNNNKYYIPTRRYDKAFELADEYWLYNLFTFNFVYWDNEKLLAVSGYDFPKNAKNLFDMSFQFQNSTDQDYEYKDWTESIYAFNKLISEYKVASIDVLLTKLDGYKKEDIEKSIEYYRKSSLYDAIYKSLHLDNWLYDNEDSYFTRFSICSIDSTEKRFELVTKLKVVRAGISL